MSQDTKESQWAAPLSAGGLSLQPNFQKGGAWQDLNFQKGVAGKKVDDFLQMGYNFYIKNKLKPEMFNDKKSL